MDRANRSADAFGPARASVRVFLSSRPLALPFYDSGCWYSKDTTIEAFGAIIPLKPEPPLMVSHRIRLQ